MYSFFERKFFYMQRWEFKSLVLCNEINLNVIATHFGITKKFKWGDPLLLSHNSLNGIIKETEQKSVYIYHFGALVFINLEYHETQDVIKYIKNIDPNLRNNTPYPYVDDYKLEVDSGYEYSLYNDLMTSFNTS